MSLLSHPTAPAFREHKFSFPLVRLPAEIMPIPLTHLLRLCNFGAWRYFSLSGWFSPSAALILLAPPHRRHTQRILIDFAASTYSEKYRPSYFMVRCAWSVLFACDIILDALPT